MKVVLQRVTEASVEVDGEVVGSIARGFLLLVGIADSDGEPQALWMADKIADLRIFRDEEGRMNLGLRDVGGGVLAISQFTLYGNCNKGRRPSFVAAGKPAHASAVFDRFVELLRERLEQVEAGVFGAMMKVSLLNDGPVTLILERE